MLEQSVQNSAKKSSAPRAIAFLSGKGGSGKTIIAAIAAKILDTSGLPTLIIDADTGTAGMTYYLGLKLVRGVGLGLTEFTIKHETPPPSSLSLARPIKGYQDALFLGIGGHRRLTREIPTTQLPGLLEGVVKGLRESLRWLIVDCRGGIDQESLAVCHVVDDIVLIVEPDVTAYQATQHLVDTLIDDDLASKIRGFIINKVFDNPSVIARTGSSAFSCEYLSSVPLDFRAIRDFYVGEVPRIYSLLGIHVWAGIHQLYPQDVKEVEGRPWSFEEFREVGITNLDSLRGGMAIAGCILLFWPIFFFSSEFFFYYRMPVPLMLMLHLVFFLGLFGSIEPTRRIIGKVVDVYVRLFKRLLFAE